MVNISSVSSLYPIWDSPTDSLLIIGKLYGEERTDCIGQKVRNSFIANMLTGAIFTAALILLYLNLAHIGQPEELLSLIRPYFLVNLASVLFMGIFFTMKQFLDGIGKTKVAMWAMIGGNVVNILGNWVLIYGVAGFPELGLLGAGISTLASRILMALAMVSIVIAARDSENTDTTSSIVHLIRQTSRR
mgnify:CR=1 FL=1